MEFYSLKDSIEKFEGLSLKVYTCPAGRLTIGYGRNLEDKGISQVEAEDMLENDLLDIKLVLEDELPFFSNLDDVRQNVLIEMGYNMGVNGLLKFKKTLNFIEKGMYKEASKEMLNSKWHRDFVAYDLQDGERSKLLRSEHLSQIMERGEF